jgi:hypothetical protein
MQLTTNGEADGPPALIENFLIKFSKQVKKTMDIQHLIQHGLIW